MMYCFSRQSSLSCLVLHTLTRYYYTRLINILTDVQITLRVPNCEPNPKKVCQECQNERFTGDCSILWSLLEQDFIGLE